MVPDVGEPAPGFELPAANADADRIRLDDAVAEGPVVLAFFPLAFTGTCTEELCSFRDDIGVYQQVDAQVLGVSRDSPPVLEAFARQQGVPFPLLSDWGLEVVPRYGGVHEELLGLPRVPKRAVFVVDRDRRVRFRWVTDDADDLPPFDDVVDALPSPDASRLDPSP